MTGHRWHLITLDPATITQLLTTVNVTALAIHTPDRDGRCPLCGTGPLCRVRIRTVRWLRAFGVRVSVLPPHEPSRPAWWCESCDCPWPCFQARVMLGEHYAGDRELTIHMGRLLHQARTELPHVSMTELAERFLAWTVSPR